MSVLIQYLQSHIFYYQLNDIVLSLINLVILNNWTLTELDKTNLYFKLNGWLIACQKPNKKVRIYSCINIFHKIQSYKLINLRSYLSDIFGLRFYDHIG